jgi:hypothetical protein
MFDFRKEYAELFKAFINSKEGNHFNLLKILLCILTKMFFYYSEGMQDKFEEFINDEDFFPNMNRLLNIYLVLVFSLSKNIYAYYYVSEINNVSKLIIQLLQSLGEGFNTKYHNNIFKFQKDVPLLDEEDKESNESEDENSLDLEFAKNIIVENDKKDEGEENNETLLDNINNLKGNKIYKSKLKVVIPKIDVTSTIYDSLITNLKYALTSLDMQSYIEDAIGKLFDLSVKSVNYDPVTVEATTEQTAPIAQTALPIQVTVNLNGVPYTASVSESVADVQEVEEEVVSETDISDAETEPEEVSVDAETEPEVDTATPTPKMCKAVDPDERKMFENASKPEAKIPEPRRRKSDNENSNLTSFGRNELENFIINRHRSFGGDMSREQVSSAMNVSLTTVDRYVARIKKYLKGIFYRGGQNTIIPAELIPRFLIDYANDKEACLVKYKKYVQKKSQIYGCYFRYKKALKEHAHSFAR